MPLEYTVTLRDGEAGAVALEGRPADPDSGCYVLHETAGLFDGPELRETIDSIPDADGSYLGPQYVAGRTPSLSGVIVGANRVDLRRRQIALAAAVRGGNGGATWTLRVSGHAAYQTGDLILPVRVAQPLASPDSGGDAAPGRWAPFTLGLRSPSPSLWSADEQLTVLGLPTDSGGRTYAPEPQTYPWDYGGEGVAPVTVVNLGAAPFWPVVDLFGPLTDPAVDNLTAGSALEFPGLELVAGDHLRVVTAPGVRTIRMLFGTPPANRYSALDRAVSQWWPIVPGPNALRLRVVDGSPPGRAEVRWRHAY